MNQWHPSHLPAQMPDQAVTDRQAGKTALTEIRAQLKKRPVSVTGTRTRNFQSWVNTPEPFRRLIARAAVLPAEVVEKLDRDLSESEKAAIRAAAARLKERADALFAI